MSGEIDIKACTILERLSAEFSGGAVDYTCTQDMHEFFVNTGGLRHEVGFAQRVLELEEIPDIEQVVAKLADQLRASSSPRRIRVGVR